MMNSAVAKRYSKALLQIAQEHNSIDSYQADLALVVETIEGSAELKAVWRGKEFDNETRIKVVKELFSGKVSDNIVNLLCVVVDKGREAFIGDILEKYKVYADEARNIAYADVISAYPMTAEQEAAIVAQLTTLSNKDVRLNIIVDSHVVGGIVVKFGDKVYDGTVAARLQGMKNKLHEVEF